MDSKDGPQFVVIPLNKFFDFTVVQSGMHSLKTVLGIWRFDLSQASDTWSSPLL